MPDRLPLKLCLIAYVLLFGHAQAANQAAIGNSCLRCHAAAQDGFNDAHGFAADNCVACHAGNADAPTEDDAHEGLIAFPGDHASAGRACGGCHADRVAAVSRNLMHTGHGIVAKTRNSLDDAGGPGAAANFQSLGHSVADSMLRKQCASCHLGQPKTKHALDVTFDRGGGCLACHVNGYPAQGHPALTARVEDGRCFGCHSRSGRISLSYTGLAEVEPPADTAVRPALQLADGRAVERLPADVHYLAGMSCIDCHTSVGLMGDAGDARYQRQVVDIACTDCHDNDNARITLADWPANLSSLRKHVPFATDAETRFLTTARNGTPLWHIELRGDGTWLQAKNSGRRLRIPEADPARVGHDIEHERLSCAACHSQWAPRCFGCHMEYDPQSEQWDHVEKRNTPGYWSDRRWGVDNALPTLGVNQYDSIEAFVPGMIMTVAHPSFDETKFVRQFAPLSPHTTGKARSCVSCHRSSEALGLGEGELTGNGDDLSFLPARDALQDGLPADAWTNVRNSLGGRTPVTGQRPFSESEMKSILDADITEEKPGTDR